MKLLFRKTIILTHKQYEELIKDDAFDYKLTAFITKRMQASMEEADPLSSHDDLDLICSMDNVPESDKRNIIRTGLIFFWGSDKGLHCKVLIKKTKQDVRISVREDR